MIPKIIHQFWVGHYKIPKLEKKLSELIQKSHPEYEYHLWTDENLFPIPEKYQQLYDLMYSKLDYVYCADILKFIAAYNFGGYILDLDMEPVTSLEDLDDKERSGIVFGHWGEGWTHCDYTLAPNIFGFEKEHPMVKFILDKSEVDLGYCNEPYGPPWMGIMVKKYLGLENEFSKEIWEYHRILREQLLHVNVGYGDYNTFQNKIIKHHSSYSWSFENKERFKNGEIE